MYSAEDLADLDSKFDTKSTTSAPNLPNPSLANSTYEVVLSGLQKPFTKVDKIQPPAPAPSYAHFSFQEGGEAAKYTAQQGEEEKSWAL